MPATGSLIPAQIDLHTVIGADFSASIILYSDAAQTNPFDLTGIVPTLVIGNQLLVLTIGSGLVVPAPATNGELDVTLTATQTAALPSNQHYYLQLVDGGLTTFPLQGTLTLLSP